MSFPPGSPLPAASSKFSALALLFVCIFGIVGTVYFYQDYIFEDSYITYRYADNIAHGLGFTFTPGERVLGTTTPLYTLLLALLSAIGLPLKWAADFVFAGALGVSAGLGSLILRRFGHPIAGIAFAALCMAGFGNVLKFWGMETTLYSAFLMATVLSLQGRRDVWAGLFVACAFLTRYDAAMFAIPMYVFMTVRDRSIPWKSGGVALLIVSPWLLFATIYFGSPLPNTLDAKTGDTAFFDYLKLSGLTLWKNSWQPLGFPHPRQLTWSTAAKVANGLVLVGFILSSLRLRRSMLAVTMMLVYPIALWVAYAYIGPSLHFGWYLIPGAYFVLLSAFLGWAMLLRALAPRPVAFVIAGACVAAFAVASPKLWSKRVTRLTTSALYQRRICAYSELIAFINDRNLNDLVLMTGEPGYLTYNTKNPAIDSAGLVTKGIYFHGDKGRKTKYSDLLNERKPGLVVGLFPNVPPNYAVIYSAQMGCELFMRLDEIAERFEHLATPSDSGGVDPQFKSFTEKPFPIDISSKTFANIKADGFIGPRMARRRTLHKNGQEVLEQVGFLKNPRNAGTVGAETAIFSVEFDWLHFQFQGNDPSKAVAQLIVGGKVVYQQGGDPEGKHAKLRMLKWPLHSLRGEQALVRFLSDDKASWVAYDHFEAVNDKETQLIEGFEDEDSLHLNWSSSDMIGSLRPAAKSVGTLGLLPFKNALSTFGLKGSQEVRSEPFPLTHNELSMLIMDHAGDGRVELWVGDAAVRSFQGNGNRVTVPVTWDVSQWKDQSAHLRLIDPDPKARVWFGIDEIRAH